MSLQRINFLMIVRGANKYQSISLPKIIDIRIFPSIHPISAISLLLCNPRLCKKDAIQRKVITKVGHEIQSDFNNKSV